MTLRNTSFHATKVFFFFFLTIICMMITATMSFQVTKDQKRCPSTTSTAAAKITTTTIIADNSVESVSFHSQQRRRDFLIGMPSALVVSGIAVSPAVLLPESAVAATTEEETIQTTTTTTTTTTSSPLRKVKSALQKLRSETVRNVVVNYEYLDLKQILRLPPLSEVRKSCSSLLKQFPQCESQYRNFIVQLEAFDTMATLGLRGKIPSWEEWNGAYERTITALQGFVTAVAEEEQRQQQQQQSEG
jgi:hypothetical protein